MHDHLRSDSRQQAEITAWLSEVSGLDASDFVRTKLIDRESARIHLFAATRAGGEARWCVKEFTGDEPVDLPTLHARACAFQSQLAAAGIRTPHVIAANEDLNALVMTAVEGRPLEDLIWQALRGDEPAECFDRLRRAAAALAEVHRLHVPDDVVMPAPCSNQEYVRRLEALSPGKFVRRCLRNSIGDPDRVIESLDEGFWSTHEKRVLHGDCQPKNFLIGESGEPILIDLSYERGHPLHDVANFVVQLERLYRRRPSPRTARRIAECKSVFLEEYAARGFSHLMPELPFFRLWTMTFSLMQDERHHAVARLYLQLIHRQRALYST